MNTQRQLDLCERIIRDGKLIAIHQTHEGDAESGPWSISAYGYRLGKAMLLLMTNGTVFLRTQQRANTPDSLAHFGPKAFAWPTVIHDGAVKGTLSRARTRILQSEEHNIIEAAK